MLYYLSAFLIYYAAVGLIILINFKNKITVFLIGLSPLIFLTALRGDIGTDTLNYLQIVSDIKDVGSSNVEIGFVLLVKCLLYFGIEPFFVLVSIALLTTLVLVLASALSRRSLLISMLCVIPVFYLDMTMNGLRYGLSFALVMISVAFFYRDRILGGAILSMCSVAVHSSGLMVLFFIGYLFSDKRFGFFSVIVLVIGLLLFGFGLYYIGDIDSGVDYTAKVLMYTEVSSPSPFSGLVPMILSLILVFVISSVDRSGDFLRMKRVYRCMLLIVVAFVLAKFSYAGLRLQFALLFSLLVGLQFKPEFSFSVGRRDIRYITFALFFVGIIGTTSFIKNIMGEADGDNSKWLPYKFNSYVDKVFD